MAVDNSPISSKEIVVSISTILPFAGRLPISIVDGEKCTQSNSEDNTPTTFSALLGPLSTFTDKWIRADSPGFNTPSLSLSLLIPVIVV